MPSAADLCRVSAPSRHALLRREASMRAVMPTTSVFAVPVAETGEVRRDLCANGGRQSPGRSQTVSGQDDVLWTLAC